MIQINAAARLPPKNSPSKLLNRLFWVGRFAAEKPRWCVRSVTAIPTPPLLAVR
jgi:hypothetical protein